MRNLTANYKSGKIIYSYECLISKVKTEFAQKIWESFTYQSISKLKKYQIRKKTLSLFSPFLEKNIMSQIS